MSTMTHPRGPLPARVYWVRRGLVLLVAFLLVFGLARLLGGGSDGSSGSNGTAQQAAADQSSQTTEPSADPTTEATPTEISTPATKGPQVTLTPKPSKTVTVPVEPDGDCAPEDVTIKPLIRKEPWGERIKVKFGLRTTEEACNFEFSNDTVVLKITSGNDQIWTSQQCQTLPTAARVLRKGEWSFVVMGWNGRRSDEECSVSTSYAKIGWYHLVAATLGGEPEDRMFELTRAPREVITETAKPETDGDKKKTNKPSTGESQPTEGPRDEGSQGADEPNG